MDTTQLLQTALKASVEAGAAIMEVYRTDFTVTHKQDASPLTLADKRSNDVITDHLKPMGIPILSEEGRNVPYLERKMWEALWIVDPLDGTKEFVKRNGEFTVNIALVQDQVPVMGVIFIPAKPVLYFAQKDLGAYRLEETDILDHIRTCGRADTTDSSFKDILHHSRRLPVVSANLSPYTIVGSRSHATPELEAFVKEKRNRFDQVDFISAGSSLKFCLVAEGKAAIYPRLGPTMEWDTAAGQAIATYAGARVYRHDTGAPLLYNRPDLLNPWFIVDGLDLTTSI